MPTTRDRPATTKNATRFEENAPRLDRVFRAASRSMPVDPCPHHRTAAHFDPQAHFPPERARGGPTTTASRRSRGTEGQTRWLAEEGQEGRSALPRRGLSLSTWTDRVHSGFKWLLLSRSQPLLQLRLKV